MQKPVEKPIKFIKNSSTKGKSYPITHVNAVIDDNGESIKSTIDSLKNKVPLTKVTWQELKDLRDSSKLTPGSLYRITDYNCTTTQENTRSAGHQFDIVLLALGEDKLAEEGWAMMHEGDEYFQNSNLSAWKVWYCLDNDTDRFAWADDSVDEGSPANIIFFDGSTDVIAIRNANQDTEDYYCWVKKGLELMSYYTEKEIPDVGDMVYQSDHGMIQPVNKCVKLYNPSTEGTGLPNGRGVIYRLIDEWGNDCPYDFKNIQFKRWAVTGLSKGSDEMKAALIYDADDNPFYFGIYDSVVGDIVTPNAEIDDLTNWAWHYTFHGWRKDADGELTPYDKSSEQVTAPEEFKQWSAEEYEEAGTTDICKNNILGRNIDRYVRDNEGSSLYGDAAQELPNNVFMSMSYCFYNEEEEYWEYSFDETYSNRLGDKCYNNTFGNDCGSNTFGNNCYNNTFGNNCYNNTFGNNNYQNSFGNYFQSNTFGNYCNRNTFGNNCYNNTFGNNCYNNTFGNRFQNNTLGEWCTDNTFGNDCGSNTFGNNNFQNSFGNYCNRNTFGNNNFQNSFGNNFEQSSIGDGVNYITVSKDYVKFIIIENGNQKITITSTATTSYSNVLRNIFIALGTNNSSNNKTISHNTVNDTFKTTYQNSNSTTKNV